jgi:hypothetical protein
MSELATTALRTVGPGDAIPNDFVVPYYEVQEVGGSIQIRA